MADEIVIQAIAKAMVEAGHGHCRVDGDFSAVYMGGSDYTIDFLKLARAALEAARSLGITFYALNTVTVPPVS